MAAEEAFRVALQTATTAAQAATAALAEIKRSQAVGLASKPKELELTGRPEEDRRLWTVERLEIRCSPVSHDQGCGVPRGHWALHQV